MLSGLFLLASVRLLALIIFLGRILHFDSAATGDEFASAVVVDGVLVLHEKQHGFLGQAKDARCALSGNHVGAILRVERFDGIAVYLAVGHNLVNVQILIDHDGVGDNGQFRAHRTDVMLAIVVHDIVGGDERGHVAAGFLGQIGIDGPIVL